MAEIKNLKKTAQRIRKAVDKKERIILYGDSDLDGSCSVLILKEAITSLGGTAAALYFPDREAEGYGITPTGLKRLKEHAPALLVVMDMGISNFEEARMAKELGFEVLIIDHHEVLEGKLPEASLIVDPKQPGDTYPFKTLAACGLTFRVAEHLLGSAMSRSLRETLVELAALGTVADMMPREQDNLEIIEEGLASMPNTWRPGLKELFAYEHLQEFETFEEKLYQAISILNVRDVEQGLPGAYRLLAAPSTEEARKLVERLAEKNKERQETIEALVAEVEDRVQLMRSAPLVFEGTRDIDYVLLGSAASRLVNTLSKPVFLYKDKGEEALGSARAPKGYDTVAAMTSCAELLLTYGGHPPASGFRLRTKNLQKFRRCLEAYFEKHHP